MERATAAARVRAQTPPRAKTLPRNNRLPTSPRGRGFVTKTLAIPYIKAPGLAPRFLVVLDKATREWSFISGCCKLHERPEACVMRELREETKEAVNIFLTPWNNRSFQLQTWRLEGDRRTTIHYYCYAIDISNYKSQNAIIEHFRDSKKAGKCYNENSDMAFCTLDQFKEKKVWSFIRRDVLESKEFKSVYASISGK